MKIITYNVNGIRAALKKDLLKWVEKENPDVLCFQEVKANKDQIESSLFEDLGYQNQNWFSAEKKGYSGVATFSKKEATLVEPGIGQELYDKEGRVLRTDYGDLTVLNCYFPSGSSGEERHAIKMKFLKDFKPWVAKLLKKRQKVVVVGDYNIVHLDIDIHNPNRRDQPSGFKPEERAWLSEWFDGEFTDAYRHLNPEQKDVYSWWSYRAGSRRKNKGWRIDYISVTELLVSKINIAGYLSKAVHSDHCPGWVDLDL